MGPLEVLEGKIEVKHACVDKIKLTEVKTVSTVNIEIMVTRLPLP